LIEVKEEVIDGTIKNTDPDFRTITFKDGRVIQVQELATILRNGIELVNFYQLKENDEITVFGLEACLEDKIDFYGFVIVVSEKDDKDSDDCNWVNTLPNFITDNNVKICLESDFYTDNLTINGNNFSLIGEANNECGDEYWTTLSGKVKINGNNAIFKNIKFTGERDKNGNNLKFINCCFKDKPI